MAAEENGTQRHGGAQRVFTPNQITEIIIGAGIEIHKELGPGLLESVYEVVLEAELRQRGLQVERQVELPVHWKGKLLGQTLRIDLLVEGQVIVELKSVEKVAMVHKKQVLTYLKLSGLQRWHRADHPGRSKMMQDLMGLTQRHGGAQRKNVPWNPPAEPSRGQRSEAATATKPLPPAKRCGVNQPAPTAAHAATMNGRSRSSFWLSRREATAQA